MTSKIRTDPSGEDALKLNSELLPALSRIYSRDALIVTNPEGEIAFWSEGAAHIFGYSAEEMIGDTFFRTVPAELQPEERELLQSLVAGTPRWCEAARLRKDGRRLNVSAAATAFAGPSGSISGILRCEREMSARTDLDEAASRLAAIVESSDDAIVSKNLDGIVTSWNQSACRLFGYTADEMIGQPILKIIPEDLYPEEAEILRKIRAGVRIEHYQTRRLRKDGQIVEVSITISPIRDASGKITGSSKIARDISEQKKMERHLLQTEKLAAAGLMAANIAHDINNPLDSVTNLIYLARIGLSEGNKARQYLITAENELERVSRLARQALGYYRDPGTAVEIQLGALLEEVLRVHQSKLLAANVAVDCIFTDQRPLTANRDELTQIFSNLITNAVEAMPNGGLLTIKTREVGDKGIEVLVRDCGIGISAENLARIFEPFFTTKGNRGTGIGLWVAQQLLQERGGSISIESKTEGADKGTSVSVFIPFNR